MDDERKQDEVFDNILRGCEEGRSAHLLLHRLATLRRRLRQLAPTVCAEPTNASPRCCENEASAVLEPDVVHLREECAHRVHIGEKPTVYQAHAFLYRRSRGMRPDTQQLYATWRAWATEYRQHAQNLRQKRNSPPSLALAEELECIAVICEELSMLVRGVL